jgi:putative ATP-binding cassette transporter
MNLLLFLIRSSPWLLTSALSTSAVSGFAGAYVVALINEALNAPPGSAGQLGVRFAALSVAVLATRWLSQHQFVLLSERTLARLRAHVSAQFAEAPYSRIEAIGGARLQAVLTEDVGVVAGFFVTLPELVMHAAIVIGCLLYLGVLSWQLLLFALAMVVLGSLGYLFAESRAMTHLRRSREHEDDLYRHFRALLDGAKELKLHRERRRHFVDQALGASIERVRSLRTRGLAIYVASASWGAFAFFVLIGSVLFVLNAWFAVEPRVLSGYALMFLYMMLPLEAVLGSLPAISRARVALERISNVGVEAGASDARGGPLATPGPGPAAAPFLGLALRQVVHRYHRDTEDGVFSLGPIDLALEPGEVVFLIGGNGSGKTTLAKLLVGLYEPESGQVIINGCAVDERGREAYRQHFSTVFSDFFLFDDALAGGRQLDARAHELLRILKLDHKLSIENGKFSTTALSLGQRKRLALLVAYLEDRPICVFDEWAADQDPSFKEVFYRELLPDLRARGKAVLVITHDDRYFSLADRFIKLESGRIVAADGLERAPTSTQREQLAV